MESRNCLQKTVFAIFCFLQPEHIEKVILLGSGRRDSLRNRGIKHTTKHQRICRSFISWVNREKSTLDDAGHGISGGLMSEGADNSQLRTEFYCGWSSPETDMREFVVQDAYQGSTLAKEKKERKPDSVVGVTLSWYRLYKALVNPTGCSGEKIADEKNQKRMLCQKKAYYKSHSEFIEYFSAWCSSLLQHFIEQNIMLEVVKTSKAIYSHFFMSQTTKVSPRNQAGRQCRAEE